MISASSVSASTSTSKRERRSSTPASEIGSLTRTRAVPAEADMAVEGSLQTLVEQQPEGDVEPRDERYRQRDRRIERLLRLPGLLPVEVEARRGPGRGQGSV